MKKQDKIKLLEKLRKGTVNRICFTGLCSIIGDWGFEFSKEDRDYLVKTIKKELIKNNGLGYQFDKDDKHIRLTEDEASRTWRGLFYWKRGVKAPRLRFLTEEINKLKL